MSQNQTQTYIPKFSYPFAQKDRKIYDDEIGKLPLGNYLFTQMGFWHGGIHFQGNDMLTNIKAEQGIKSIADGELVAYRINENYHDEGNGIYSTGFFLVRHKLEYPTNNKLIFFSLYMHTAKKDAYNIIQNQTNQSNTTNYYTVKKGDTLGKIAKEHHTTVDKLRQDNNIVDVNKIREGHVLIIKTNNHNSSSQTSQPTPSNSNPNSNPNFIIENPQFDKVVVLSSPIKIKAGEVIGLMGEYNVKENSQDKCLHLEVFASKEFKTFVQTAKQGDNKLPQSFNWATIIDEQSSTDHISIFKNLEVVFKNSDETLRMNPMFNELFKLIDKGSQENGDGILHVEEISDSAKNPIIKKVTNNYIVKHSSEWDKTVNMADLLNDIVDKIDKSEFETKDEYKELLKKEKKRIEKLSFFAECKDKIEGFPKDDIVYVMNPVGLVNQFNKKCLITKEMLIAMGCTEASNNQLLIDALNKYCKEYEINTCLRVAHFLSQAAHESGGFITQTEDEHYRESVALQNSCYLAYRNTSIGRNIQLTPRKDKHGNVQKDSNGNIIYNCKQPEYFNCKYANKNGNGDFTSRDGHKYRGRGIMQITGRETYRNYKNDHTQRNPNDIKDFEANPELVTSSKEYEVASGCSYWFNKTRANKNLNLWADEGSSDEVVLKVSAVVNGFYDKNEEQYNKFSTSEKAKYLKVEDDLYLKIPNGYDEPNKPFSRLPLFHKLKNHMGL